MTDSLAPQGFRGCDPSRTPRRNPAGRQGDMGYQVTRRLPMAAGIASARHARTTFPEMAPSAMRMPNSGPAGGRQAKLGRHAPPTHVSIGMYYLMRRACEFARGPAARVKLPYVFGRCALKGTACAGLPQAPPESAAHAQQNQRHQRDRCRLGHRAVSRWTADHRV